MRIVSVRKYLQTTLKRSPLACLFLLITFTSVGCSGSAQDAVQPNLAKETLITTLTAWKSGETPGQLQSRSPAIVVQDMDWTAGAKLQDFILQGDGKAIGANLSIEVELALVDSKGKASKPKVWYLVGTDPALTVFRDMLHP